MKTLTECREIINGIDPVIKEEFIRRMETVRDVALYKIANDMPVFDEKREKEIVERLSSDVTSELKPYYVEFLEAMFKISREYQTSIINSTKQ